MQRIGYHEQRKEVLRRKLKKDRDGMEEKRGGRNGRRELARLTPRCVNMRVESVCIGTVIESS